MIHLDFLHSTLPIPVMHSDLRVQLRRFRQRKVSHHQDHRHHQNLMQPTRHHHVLHHHHLSKTNRARLNHRSILILIHLVTIVTHSALIRFHHKTLPILPISIRHRTSQCFKAIMGVLNG